VKQPSDTVFEAKQENAI